MQREKKILSDCSTEFKETVWDWKAGGHKSSSVGLCHLQLPVLITYCDKLQSFERPDLLCFSCSRECAWHWVAELQSPSFSTMSPQVIVFASSSVSLVPILENVQEGGHPRSWNWKEDWAQHWPGVSLDELGHGRSWDRKQGWKGRAVMIPCQCCAWSHFQCCDPLWPTSLRMVRVKSLQACPDDQCSQLSPAAALVIDHYGLSWRFPPESFKNWSVCCQNTWVHAVWPQLSRGAVANCLDLNLTSGHTRASRFMSD